MPGGLSVVGLDQAGIAGDQFGVVAIGEFGVQRISSGFAIHGVEGPFERDGQRFRQRFRAADRFDVLVDKFLRVLGTNRGAEREKEKR